MNDSLKNYNAEYWINRKNISTLYEIVIGGITYKIQQAANSTKYSVCNITVSNVNVINYKEKTFPTYKLATEYLNTLKLEALLNS